MKSNVIVVTSCTLLAGVLVLWQELSPTDPAHQAARVSPQRLRMPVAGNPARLHSLYDRWKQRNELLGSGSRIALGMSWSKALSTEYTRARGVATIDLEERTVAVEVSGFGPDETGLDAWMIEYRPGMGAEYSAEENELLVHLGTIEIAEGAGLLRVPIDDGLIGEFELELVAVSRAGTRPSEGGLIYGTPDLFQRIYSRDYRAAARAADRAERRAVGGLLLAMAAPQGPTETEPGPLPTFEELIREGERLFCEETFLGNGRTCCTCHPQENNFTIEPLFIAKLPANDPLFVAEFIPALNKDLNGGLVFENPVLMREFGLIVENLDGFGDLTTMFTMRSVPHTLGMRHSMEPIPGSPHDGVSELLGWSGDGSPDGTLRGFAQGAVVQHYPKTTNRVPGGVDFRLPTPDELTAMEAFQRSLGRPAELDLTAMTFIDQQAEIGKEVFNSPTAGKCFLCHFNAGSNVSFVPPAGTFNGNFDTGVEAFTQNHPDGTGEPRPIDGGFGTTPNPNGGFGDGTFNTPSLVEFADTVPAFHSNITNIPGSGLPDTVEGGVLFYNTKEFDESPSGTAVGGISLSPTEVAQVGKFLRVVNALENERSARDLALRAKAILQGPSPDLARSDLLLNLGAAECEDAIQVLAGANLHMSARTRFHKARQNLLQATHGPLFLRVSKIDRALELLAEARDLIVIE